MKFSRKHIMVISAVFFSLSVSIIVFGSIINFHQYKIWGKPLIPQFVGLKHEGKKIAKLLPSSGSSSFNTSVQKYPPQASAVLTSGIASPCSGVSCFIPLAPDFKVPVLANLAATGLRAPPRA